MYTGFNLQLDQNATIFCDGVYEEFIEVGKQHLDNQEATYKMELKKYVRGKEIDGTKIQKEWFPQIEADIFISHSHKDEDLACALAGWIYENFGLKCFIDSNVWGYADELLEEMNEKLSHKRSDGKGGYLYNHQSCNQVSQHVNTMLSIALQKMIDKVEAIILLNTEQSIQVCSDSGMNKTYSPWIYSEIICTQIVRKKPLLAYRDYRLVNKSSMILNESVQFLMHSAISYTVSLKHLKELNEEDLRRWKIEYLLYRKRYEYALDVLYEFMCPNEVDSTKKLFEELEDDELKQLKKNYSIQDMNSEEYRNTDWIWNEMINKYVLKCSECDKYFYTYDGKTSREVN